MNAIVVHSLTFRELDEVEAIKRERSEGDSFTYWIKKCRVVVDDRARREPWREALKRAGVKRYNLAAIRRACADGGTSSEPENEE